MTEYGRFSGNPITEWLTDEGEDRRMKLVEDFWYEDPDNHRWIAPAGSTVDGASIPASLWSLIGSPYTGEYRRASIVHDIACGDDHSVRRKDADKMFYYACLAGGCTLFQAQMLYAGVRIGAWVPNVRLWYRDNNVHTPTIKKRETRPTLADESMQTTFHEIAADIQAKAESLPFTELELIVDKHLKAKAHQ
jgi:hypothetical protein